MNLDKNNHYRQLALYYKNRAKLKKCTAAVHLEANDDQIFWNKVFEYYLPQYSFDYITYSRTPEGKKVPAGCEVCLKYYHLECLSKEFFVCIDSDYRWLLQEKDIDIDHYIFQTYTYSFENHYCFSQNVDAVFKQYRQNQFNAYSFLKAYSTTLYNLIICHLISISKDDKYFPLKSFRPHLALKTNNMNGYQIIANLKQAIATTLATISSKYTKSDIHRMRRRCGKLGLTSKNAYLYLRGHNIFDDVIGILLKQLGSIIGNNNISIGNNICFDKYPEINRIKTDTQKYKQLYTT